MKRIKVRHKILFILLLWSGHVIARISSEEVPAHHGDWAAAQEWSWTSRIRVQTDLNLHQKPSSLQGESHLDWGSLGFSNLWEHAEEPFEVAITGQVGPARDKVSRQPQWQWDELRLTWKHKPRLSMGVLIDPVLGFDDREWQGQAWGLDFRSGLERFGLLPASDLGVQLRLATSLGDIALQVSHGSGFPNAETGPRKDSEFIWEPTVPTGVGILKAQFFYRYGQHEHLTSSIEKIRAGLQLALQDENWSLGAAGTNFQDPVDGMTGIIGEGADLIARGGEINKGQLLEAWWRYKWGDDHLRPWRVSMRSEHLKTDLSDSEKNVIAQVFSVGKTLTPGMQIQLAGLQTSFGKNHSMLAKDRQLWMFSWAWSFERRP